MYGAVDHLGWAALIALRLLAAAALFAVLALTLVRRRQPIASFLVVLGIVVGVEVLLQDRPATVSLVFLALLGPACERLWVTGRRPPPAARRRRMPAVGPAARPVGARAGGLRRRRSRGAARPRPGADRSAARCPRVRRRLPGGRGQSTGARFVPAAAAIPGRGGNAHRRVGPTTFTMTLRSLGVSLSSS